MTQVERSYDDLQTRWFSGEPLSPEEERRRVELALSDPLFASECAVLARLSHSLSSTQESALDQALVEKVLARAGLLSPVQVQAPTLRLVKPGADETPAVLPARRFRAPRGWSLGLAAAAALAAGAALWTAQSAAPKATGQLAGPVAVTASVGDLARAELVFESGERASGAEPSRLGGRPLEQGAHVETADGQACFTIDPGVDVCLGAHSLAELSSLRAQELVVHVKRGLVIATLKPRAAGQSFSLSADGVRATAKGTTFGVDTRAASPEVIVLEGAVEVNAGATRELVRDHMRWGAAAGRAPVQSAVGRAEEAQFWALLAPRELWRHGEVGILELQGVELGLEASIDEGRRFTLPLLTFVPAGKRRVSVRHAAGTETEYLVEVEAGERRRLDVGDASNAVQVRAAASPKFLLEQARAKLKLGRVSEALAGYAELRRAFPGSAEARTVLPTMGRMELEQRNNPARALAHFEAYLAQPGPLQQEALSGKVRALRALGRTTEERLAIEQYLRRHPAGLEARALGQRRSALGAR